MSNDPKDTAVDLSKLRQMAHIIRIKEELKMGLSPKSNTNAKPQNKAITKNTTSNVDKNRPINITININIK